MEFAVGDGGIEIECRPDGDWHCRPDRCLTGETLSLAETIDEFQADDRRRSVFLDPAENVISTLIDYYSGRLNSVEFRNPDWAIDFEALRERALEHVRETLPIVSINHAAAQNDQEIIFLLRLLADNMEEGTFGRKGPSVSSKKCTRSTNTVGSRWSDNGRTLEIHFQEIERCCTKDGCCGNETCTTNMVRDWWDVTWRDNGSASPPLISPPPYQNVPWNNQGAYF